MLKTPSRFPFIALVCACLLSFLTSCDLDENISFLEETRTGYLLYQNSDGEKGIVLTTKDGIQLQWNEGAGIADRSISDISSFEKELWIASEIDRKLYEIDVLSGTVNKTIGLRGISPTYISVGEDEILIADSSQNQAFFLNKKTERISQVALPAEAGTSTYKSRKFYLKSGSSTVLILQEDALAEITRLQLERPIFEIQSTSDVSIIVSTRDSGNFEALVNYNTNGLSRTEIAVAYRKIRVSPFSRQLYGKEQLQPFTLTENLLQPTSQSEVTDFEVDFFENHLWIVRNDSLGQIFPDGSLGLSISCEGCSLMKSYFFQDFVGD
ncbi:MAG: hypothetical protein AAGC85_20695 [Bacteroidota bacterium]